MHFFFLLGILIGFSALLANSGTVPSMPIPAGKIVGCKPATPGAYPFIVSLQDEALPDENKHFCGGSILNPSVIVTAAHCVVHPREISIRAGSNQRASGGVVVPVARVLIHPKYGIPDARRKPLSLDYDVALIFLAEPLNETATIGTIVLPNAGSVVPGGTLLTAIGWGIDDTKANQSGNPLPALDLHQVTLPVLSRSKCRKMFWGTSEEVSRIFTHRMLCAGKFASRIGTSFGDSGGPLLKPIADGEQSVLVGITSWGVPMVRMPSVYTNIGDAEIGAWIRENM